MNLRARLVLGATAAVAVAIVLASVLVYFLVRNELRTEVDNNLRAEAAQLNLVPRFGTIATQYPHIYALDARSPLFASYFQMVDSDGDIYIPAAYVASTPRVAVTSRVRAVASGHGSPFFYDTNLQGEHTRVFTRVSTDLAPRVAIQVVGQLSGVDHELSRLRLWLILVAAGGIAVASGTSFLVARTTLRPVRNLSETAERVRATRDLSQRIEVAGSDELSQLAVTFNAMLESLDEAAQRQQQLVQDASHELRTPLTSLRTNIEVLAHAELLPPEEREHLLHDVVDQLGEMTELISELTELARGTEQAAALEDVRLDLVTEEAIRRTQRNHPEIPIHAELAPTSIVGMPASLERAIGNLLDNAAKWSPAGSAVDVHLAGNELTVRDHGPGIAADDVPHIFERFYRATSARSMPGSGLGLSIVQKVADAHGASISVEAAEGGGTLMRLTLPERNGPAPDGEDD